MDFWTNGVGEAYDEANGGGIVFARAACLDGGAHVQAQGRAVASVSPDGNALVLEGVCDQPWPDAPSDFPGPDGIYFWVNSPKAAPENTSVLVQFLIGDDDRHEMNLTSDYTDGATISEPSPTERNCDVTVQDKDLNGLTLRLSWSISEGRHVVG
jgi:hypothetical protein